MPYQKNEVLDSHDFENDDLQLIVLYYRLMKRILTFLRYFIDTKEYKRAMHMNQKFKYHAHA